MIFRVSLRLVAMSAAMVVLYAPAMTRSQGVVWVQDGYRLPEHRARGQARAEADIKLGRLKLYVPLCTFPRADKKAIRRFEIRRDLLKASNITVIADLCNDIVPDGVRQEAFVEGYNAIMNREFSRRLGPDWKAVVDRQVADQLRKHPQGALRAGDADVETP